MSGHLSVISGGFAKTLVLATYLPTLAFSILALAVMGPLLAEDWTPIFPLTLESLDPQWRLLVFTLFTFVLSGMLYYLNAPIVRLYEGCPWQATWIGRLSSARQLARYNRLEAR